MTGWRAGWLAAHGWRADRQTAAMASGVINATPFNAGIGVTGAVEGAICNYRPATEAELSRCAAIEAVLETHDVPLAAASLQFPLGHPAVASVICGFGSESEIRQWAPFQCCLTHASAVSHTRMRARARTRTLSRAQGAGGAGAWDHPTS
eukprot:COSAG01_NODE_2981_length_6758_cov_11.354408_4_plen_150_part_00